MRCQESSQPGEQCVRQLVVVVVARQREKLLRLVRSREKPFSEAEQKMEQPPFDGPELKFRFGRHIEARTKCNIFGYRL